MTATHTLQSAPIRRLWRVEGQVQGVGFRPFVFLLANRCGLTGNVCNDHAGVLIDAQGTSEALAQFEAALTSEAPPLARIDKVTALALPALPQQVDFHIRSSTHAQAPATAAVSPDAAVCPDCLAEMRDHSDRRGGYGLINCTHCGPRFSIIRAIPYDRTNTTMAGFALCEPCDREYHDPANRRFHAQPVACPHCGPQVTLVTRQGQPLPGDVYEESARLLMLGRVLAIKGVGGFHLAARALDHEAVRRLRRLKQRDHKPLAVMCRDIEEARQYVSLSNRAVQEMLSPACPIMLATRRPVSQSPALAAEIAPGTHRLGVMLPYTPMQHLLLDAGRRLDATGLGPLVMTSANVSDEPLVTDDDEAMERLGKANLCDAILWHNRPIERCVDDSVMLDMRGGSPLPLRRSRGYAPTPLRLPLSAAEPGLCVGGELKNVVAVVRGNQAILSQHLGDLKHALALQHFGRTIDDLCRLFEVQPRWIAHDLHPGYLSSEHARQLGAQWDVPLIAVQHHHAHAAAVMAEHHTSGPVLAVVCDGVGYGDDGTAWGGELLLADMQGYQRLAHLDPLRLPGGDAAARDTRRCALAMLYQAYGDGFADHDATVQLVPDRDERLVLTRMIRAEINCVRSSAAGRVFDGAAALLNLATHNHHEAQAALRLEAEAHGVHEADCEDLFEIRGQDPWQINLTPLTRQLVAHRLHGGSARSAAAMVHDQLVRAWTEVTAMAAQRHGLRTVVLSGGVFCNRRLVVSLTRRLVNRGLMVLRHRLVPPTDAGLALGQAAVAAARCRPSRSRQAPVPAGQTLTEAPPCA